MSRRGSIPRSFSLKVVVLIVVPGPGIINQLVNGDAVLWVLRVDDLSLPNVNADMRYTGPPGVLEEDDVTGKKLRLRNNRELRHRRAETTAHSHAKLAIHI
jgi:hypothetical protein